ncbi:hypothetical protein W911_02660 [Hyphomicrobium nitrativorans NL23]|uniref:N-acetyltransferase domain-containing protein n=1 Tax=Hyphomicrobium nitrativorans NL23 TaxID=1029756 RepID=V5SH94_9HYPH|nr:GNAT family protein [Hyphomicrobium nitrativorans]AHB49862.1 hypothetical protein W911_02660 [Hyphomicrobium nitrativorans NL23]
MQKPLDRAPRHVTFRDVRETDFPLLFSLRRDIPLQALLLTVPPALDDAALEAWIRTRQQEPGGLFQVVEDASAGDAIGFVQITQVHHRNRVGYAGVCLAAHARGRGLGQATLRKLIDTSRDQLGLLKLMSEVRIDNFPALRYNMVVGFHIVGTLKAHFVDAAGLRHDALLLECPLDQV